MKLLSNAVVFIAAAIAASPSVVVADVRHVSPLESTRLFPDVDFQVDVDVAVQSHSPNPCANKEGRRVGKAWVYPAFVQKLQKATGKTVDLPGSSFQVQTLYITETTNPHVDTKLAANGVGGDLKRSQLKASDADGSMTAFYVQKSTADAYFETDDDEMCIPIVEGSALYFNGGLPHHTVLNSPGAIKLVGPFLLSTLESVGCCADETAVPYDLECCECEHSFNPQECCGVVPPESFFICPSTKSAKTRSPKSSKSPASSSLVANQLKSDGFSLSSLAGIITLASSIVVVSVFLHL